MTNDFRTSASRLAGIIPARFSWTPDQFWDATPAELTAILNASFAASTDNQPAEPLTKTQLDTLKETLDHG